MKRIIKNNLFGFILGGIIFGGLVYAANYMASDVTYKPKNKEWKVSNVNEAINDLYNSRKCNMNGTEPVISGDLIPITLSNDGTVTYADTKENWYNYCKKEWANAVILIDNPSKTYKVGDTILEDDIESYFVWIPRYRYKLWNTGTAIKNAHEIEVEFETKETTPSTGDENGEWLTHPAFTTLDVNGIWVGKFETGYKGATTTATAQVSSSDNSKIIVKPNVFSWRNNTVYNFFVASYNYDRDLDSHMMKNTEWGAVSYLSHSKYGINREININNNSSHKTGYSALPSTYQHTFPASLGDGEAYNNAYNTEIGYLASTTGNITGVYDMNGGAHEYMAAYRNGTLGSSGFNATTISNYDSKYFDVYNASSAQTTYQFRILGDATGEIGPFESYLDGDNNSRYHNNWYGNSSHFVESSNPWFHRGGQTGAGVLSGQFYFDRYTGAGNVVFSSRLVLSAQ